MAKYLYNTTFTVDVRLRRGWLKWMSEIYIPTMKKTAGVDDHELYTIDGSLRDGAESYSSQWRCETITQLSGLRITSSRLCQEMAQTHGEKCLAFSTMMKGLDA